MTSACLVVAPSQRGQPPWALVFRIFLYSCLLCTPIVFKAALAEASGAWQVAQCADTRAFALCLLVLPRSQRWVERLNEGAIALYKASGFKQMPAAPQYDSFTSALKLSQKEPLLFYKDLR